MVKAEQWWRNASRGETTGQQHGAWQLCGAQAQWGQREGGNMTAYLSPAAWAGRPARAAGPTPDRPCAGRTVRPSGHAVQGSRPGNERQCLSV